MLTVDILVVLGYRVKRSVLLVFWYRQRFVHNPIVFHLLPEPTHPAARFVCDS